MRRPELVFLAVCIASCSPAAPPDPRSPTIEGKPGRHSGGSGGDRIIPPEELVDHFVLRCEDSPAQSRTGVVSPLLGISAPRPPPDDRTKSVIRRYRVRPPEGAAELPPDVATALDASRADFDACLEDERIESDVKLTITVDPEGHVESVGTSEDRDRVHRCLMVRACELRGAPHSATTKAVLPLAVRRIVALNGVAVGDLPAVSIASAKLTHLRGDSAEGAERTAVTDAAISLMTQAAAVCRRAPLIEAGVYATFELGFTPHSTVAPTLSFGEITRGAPPPDQALLDCVRDSLEGYRMPGMWYGGSLTVRVTWDP